MAVGLDVEVASELLQKGRIAIHNHYYKYTLVQTKPLNSGMLNCDGPERLIVGLLSEDRY